MNKIEFITEEQKWHEILAGAQRLHPSFSPEWENMISDVFPYVTFQHVLYKEKWGLRLASIADRVTTTPFSDGGDVVALGAEKLALEELSRDLAEYYSSYRVQVNGYLAPISGDVNTDLVDYIVDLEEGDILLSSFRSTLRHVLERDSDLHFSPIESKEEMKQVYRIYLSMMKSVRNLALPFSAFKYLKGSHDVFVARKGGRILSFAIFMTTRKNTSYYLSGATQEGKELDAPSHLLFYCMSHYYNLGMEKMYLGGTRKDTGLDIFKRGWRGKAVPVYTVSDSEVHDDTRTSPLRSLWSLVPTPLTPHLSKVIGKYVF